MRFTSAFILSSVLVFALLAPLSPARAVSGDCATKFGRLIRSKSVTEEDIQLLRREIKQPVKTVKAMAIPASKIEKITKIHTGGAFASAALEVQTEQGIKFLKIYDESKLKNTAYTQVIQNAFARKGMAPKVTGYLSPAEVQKLVARFPELKKTIGQRSTTFAVLTDRIDPVVGISKYIDGKIPPAWTTGSLETRVKEFESVMSDLRIIPPGDLQAAIDKDGNFILYDFDGYGHVTKGDQVFSTESQRGQRTLEEHMERTYNEDLQWAEDNAIDVFRVDEAGRFNVRLSGLRETLGLPE